VLFGGVAPGGIGLSDTWSYGNGRWTLLTPTLSPSSRWDSSLAYDPHVGGLLLFGGCSSIGCWSQLDDTWVWSNGNWTNLTSALHPAPSARGGSGIAYDAADGYLVLFAGAQSNGRLDDTWLFVGNVTTNGSGGSGGSGGHPVGAGGGPGRASGSPPPTQKGHSTPPTYPGGATPRSGNPPLNLAGVFSRAALTGNGGVGLAAIAAAAVLGALAFVTVRRRRRLGPTNLSPP
jgi:hypothetical protein